MNKLAPSKIFSLVLIGALFFLNLHCADNKSSIGRKSRLLKSTTDLSPEGRRSGNLYFSTRENDYLKGRYLIFQISSASKSKNNSDFTTQLISNLPAILKIDLDKAKSLYHIKIEVESFQMVEIDLLKAGGKEQFLMLGGGPFALEVKFSCDLKDCDNLYMSVLNRDLKPKKLSDIFNLALPPIKLWLNEENQLMGASRDFSKDQNHIAYEAMITNPYYFLNNLGEFENYEWTPLPR